MMYCRYCRLRHTCDDYRYYDERCCNKFTFDTSLSVDDVCGRKKQPTTNAEYIRSMTDEELVEIIECPYGMQCPVGHGTCGDCILDWLKKPKEKEE